MLYLYHMTITTFVKIYSANLSGTAGLWGLCRVLLGCVDSMHLALYRVHWNFPDLFFLDKRLETVLAKFNFLITVWHRWHCRSRGPALFYLHHQASNKHYIISWIVWSSHHDQMLHITEGNCVTFCNFWTSCSRQHKFFYVSHLSKGNTGVRGTQCKTVLKMDRLRSRLLSRICQTTSFKLMEHELVLIVLGQTFFICWNWKISDPQKEI